MLGDDVYASALKVGIEGADLSAKLVLAVIDWIAHRGEVPIPEHVTGFQTIQELNEQDIELGNVEIDDDKIEGIKKEINKYGIDFAITKNGPNSGFVWFKGKDVAQIEAAMKGYTKAQEEKQKKKEEAPRKKGVRDRIKEAKEDVAKEVGQVPEKIRQVPEAIKEATRAAK